MQHLRESRSVVPASNPAIWLFDNLAICRTALPLVMSQTPLPFAAPLDLLDLYELCVQSPAELVSMLQSIHGGSKDRAPLVLGEDFCGSGATSIAWLKAASESNSVSTSHASPRRTAVACDLDPVAIARLRNAAKSLSPGTSAKTPPLKAIARDVVTGKPALDAKTAAADIVFVGNFSIGYIHTRQALVKYFKRSRSRLKRGGVVIIDTYGGATSHTTGSLKRKFKLPDGRTVHYTWQQRAANPITAMVENALHFRVEHKGEIIQDIPDGFVYHWRLWTVPELHDAMTEAGLRRIEVFDQVPQAKDGNNQFVMQPIDGSEMDDSFAVLVSGRK